MSSDGYFDGEDGFDSDAFAQIDAIEAAYLSPQKQTSKKPTNDDSFDEFSFNADESELKRLDEVIRDAYGGDKLPVAGPSKFTRTSSSNMVQTTLFGGVAGTQNASNNSKPRSQMQRTTSTQRNPFGQQARKTKKWDQTAFAKSGVKQAKPKDKGKQRAGDESGDEPVEFEQFPAPFVSLGPPPPMKLAPDLLEVKHWIYPLNKPKRDYQYNIVKHCLFDNTLVALPTGLGKTFIAGVVMLNFYRWFPEGKVVFVAPTKPLVAQQVTACHETCGIPAVNSIELTGEVPRTTRIKAWSEKRVFFMTPQTLVNDLVKETCDVRDIILLVVDEAHRASGNYAYNQAIRYLMAKNPHFRVLALTATPGNDPKTIQTLIDGLHISRIEIRNEESLDLKQYIHKKIFVPHVITANTAVAKIRDLLVNVMNPLMKPMLQAGVLRPGESAVSIHPYRPQALIGELKDRRFLWPLAMLAKLARAMLYLLTGSIEACYQFLYDITTDPEVAEGDEQNKKAKGRKLKEDPNFRILMQELERQKATGFNLHPKMEVLLNILIQHFGRQEEGLEETRVMVFSSYRAVVDRIVEELAKHKPLLRATRFIGQSTDKQGKRGLAQKEQQEVIEKFQAGEYNILVATSIGEEGLDIGEIDVTICYDADKAPTRMIQRFGRTGRKRDGTIHALLSEEREELNIEKAEATYREVQKQISRGEMYELYGDVERLIPEHMKPECIEKVVEIQEYVRSKASPRKKATAALGIKRKRNDDVMRNIPEGASTGFVSVRDLIVKNAPKTKKVKISKNFDADGKDDETDEDIESGRILVPPRRAQSAIAGSSAASNGKTKERGKLRKSSTTRPKASNPRPKKKAAPPTLSQFTKQGTDDPDDMDIGQGAILKHQSEQPSPPQGSDEDERDLPRQKSPPKKRQSRTILSLSPEPSPHKVEPLETIVELTDSERGRLSPSPSHHISPIRQSPAKPPACRDDDMGWLVDDDEDHLHIEIVDSSPLGAKNRNPSLQMADESTSISRPRLNNHSRNYSPTSQTLVDDSIVEVVEHDLPSKSFNGKTKQQPAPSSSPEVLVLKNSNVPKHIDSPVHQRIIRPKVHSTILTLSSSPFYPTKDTESMPPPPVVSKGFLARPSSPAEDIPEPTYPVRPLGHQPKRRRIIVDEADSPAMDEPPPPSQPRLYRLESTPVSRKEKIKTKRTKPTLLGRSINPVFDAEAAHSGDEVSEGESNSEDDLESESDRQFIKDSPLTQMTPSYEQTQIYRKSLMTQPENDGAGPVFAHPVLRPKGFGRIDGPRMVHHPRRGLPSSSPPPPDEELDHYEFGSFVVPDDDISYAIDD